jgi:MFS family permease
MKALAEQVASSFQTCFNVAYCVMLIPSQIILTYVRPSYWLSGLEILWGLITGLMAIVHSAKQVYILRVFLGLCESSAWPGMMTLLSELYDIPWPMPPSAWLVSSKYQYANRL